jgi:hypothetical protein
MIFSCDDDFRISRYKITTAKKRRQYLNFGIFIRREWLNDAKLYYICGIVGRNF